MLALHCDLISEYIAFQRGQINKYDKETIRKLFKYLQPFKMSVTQKEHIGLSDELIKSLVDGGFVKIRRFVNEKELIESTKLKIMLTKDSKDGTYPYPYINILNDEVDVSFTATYKSGDDRDKAIEHIRALLVDANEISIYDRYLSKINYSSNSWDTNKLLLLNILPRKAVDINIYCQDDWNINRENDLLSIYSEWSINREEWGRNIHDRYIETDKVIILLSSGLINLASISKDFTYIIKVK